jgi:hypothetical protein
MEIFKKLSPDLRPGDRGGAFLRVKTEIDLKRGLVKPLKKHIHIQ